MYNKRSLHVALFYQLSMRLSTSCFFFACNFIVSQFCLISIIHVHSLCMFCLEKILQIQNSFVSISQFTLAVFQMVTMIQKMDSCSQFQLRPFFFPPAYTRYKHAIRRQNNNIFGSRTQIQRGSIHSILSQTCRRLCRNCVRLKLVAWLSSVRRSISITTRFFYFRLHTFSLLNIRITGLHSCKNKNDKC